MKTYSDFDDVDGVLRRAIIKALAEKYEGEFRAFSRRKGVPACDVDEVLNTFWITLLKIPLTKLSIKAILVFKLLQVIRDYWRGRNRKKRRMLEFQESPPEITQAPIRPEPRSEEDEDWLMRVFFEEYPANLSKVEKIILFKGMRGHCQDTLALKLGMTRKDLRIVLRRAVRKFRKEMNDNKLSRPTKRAAASAPPANTLKPRKTNLR